MLNCIRVRLRYYNIYFNIIINEHDTDPLWAGWYYIPISCNNYTNRDIKKKYMYREY